MAVLENHCLHETDRNLRASVRIRSARDCALEGTMQRTPAVYGGSCIFSKRPSRLLLLLLLVKKNVSFVGKLNGTN